MNKAYLVIILIGAALAALVVYRHYVPVSCSTFGCATCQDAVCAENAAQIAEESHEAPCCQKAAGVEEKINDIK